MADHSALRSRIVSPNQLRPKTRKQPFAVTAMIGSGLEVGGATELLAGDHLTVHQRGDVLEGELSVLYVGGAVHRTLLGADLKRSPRDVHPDDPRR